jgi:hypothetical protein
MVHQTWKGEVTEGAEDETILGNKGMNTSLKVF